MRLRRVWVAALSVVAATAAGGTAAALDNAGHGPGPLTAARAASAAASPVPAPGSTGPVGGSHAPAARVAADCGGPAPAQGALSTDPSRIVITCADGGIGLQGMHWTAWGAALATGNGTLWFNECTPDCASGTVAHFAAAVTLSGVVAGPAGPVFTRASLTYAGDGPPVVAGQPLTQFTLWYPRG